MKPNFKIKPRKVNKITLDLVIKKYNRAVWIDGVGTLATRVLTTMLNRKPLPKWTSTTTKNLEAYLTIRCPKNLLALKRLQEAKANQNNSK